MKKEEKENLISLIKEYRFRIFKFEPIAKDLKRFHSGINTEELFQTLIQECMHKHDVNENTKLLNEVKKEISSLVKKYRQRISVKKIKNLCSKDANRAIIVHK